MEPLLFLSHRLPYPPNKGDKVRSYHFLKHLAQRYRLYLGTFIDDAADWQHVEALKSLCADVHVEGIVPWSRRAWSTTGFLRGEALTLPYFRSGRLQQWVDDTVRRENVTRAFTYSSPMAQYVCDRPRLRCFVDFVDMDSAKWGDYALTRQWPVSALYKREGSRLLSYEQQIAARAEAIIFVTDDEAQLFRDKAPDCAARVVAIENGVNSEYFSPSSEFRSPYSAGEHPIVFTGAMDYWPNVDAVLWFAREVLPAIRTHDPAARFYVVGMNPDASVRALASDPATVVTGRVNDVRPYLQHARVAVAPLRVARGIQNKVLEAMAMAKATVVTAAVARALKARPGIDLEVANDAGGFALKVIELLDAERAAPMERFARARVLQEYAWASSFGRLDEVMDRASVPTRASLSVRPSELHYATPGK